MTVAGRLGAGAAAAPFAEALCVEKDNKDKGLSVYTAADSGYNYDIIRAQSPEPWPRRGSPPSTSAPSRAPCLRSVTEFPAAGAPAASARPCPGTGGAGRRVLGVLRRLGLAMRRPANGSGAVRCAANTAGIARLSGIVAGALLLAYAVAFPAPVQAQSTDPVWSTTMTVGDTSGDGRGYAHTDFSNPAGSLGSNEFTVPGDDTFQVQRLLVDTESEGGAALRLSSALANIDDYILEIAGVELPLDSYTNGGGSYITWNTAWLAANAPALDAGTFQTTLPVDGEVLVCLRTATQICPKAPGGLPWSTTMTVGDASGDGRGFQVAGYANYDEAGSLGVSEFTVPGDQTYQVLLLAVDTDWQNGAAIVLSSGLANEDDYILELAGVELPLDSSVSISVVDGSTNFFAWFTPWLAANAPALDADTYETTLPLDGMVRVCLRTTTQVCPGGGTLSTDATLSALVVNDGTTDHTIDLATTPYTLNVGNAVTTVTLTAEPTHSGAAVSAVTLGGTAIADTVFTDGITVSSLVEGANAIVVTVMAEDGSTAPYMVTVTREASTTVCTAPDLSGRTQIWTGTVTVGAHEFFGSVAVYGFGSGFGALDNTQFRVGTNDYTVDYAGVDASTTTPGRLSFGLTGALAAADSVGLTLHVCDAAFAFADAAFESTQHSYSWDSAGLDWSSETTRTLYLSVLDVTIEAEHESIGAGLEDLNFTLTRTGDTTEPLSAQVTITQEQSWLADLSHTVTFLAGEPTATLTIAASKFSFTPSTTGDLTATVSGGSDTVQIVSTSAPPITVGFDKSEYTFEEDETDPAAVYMVATLDAAYPRAPSRVFGNDAQFAVSTQSDTARFRDDFASVNTLVDLRADDFQLVDGLYVARKPISDFAILDDAIYEGSEQFLLTLNNGANLNTNVFRIQKPDGTAGGSYDVIITDDEDRPVLSLSVDPPSIAEEDDDTTTGVTENVSTVTVAIDNDKTFVGEETVTLTFSGDATEGTHYSVSPMDADTNAAGHQVLLPADDGDDLNDSDSSVAVTVTAAGNDTADGNVTLTVTGDFDGTDIGSRDITIVDDDTTTTNTAATGAPGIMGTPREGHDLTATIGTIMDDTDGLPTFPDDYTFQWVRLDSSNTPTNIGTNSSTYPVLPADVDSTIRVDVNFTDLAGNPEGPFMSAAVGPVVALLPELSFAETTVNVDETAGPVELTVNLAPASTGTVTVDYATSNGPSGFDGAEAGEDYTAQSDTLTFIPGETSKTITIQITDDDIHEADVEFFVVDLANPSGATESATAGKTEVHITSEDSVPVASMDDVSVDEGAVERGPHPGVMERDFDFRHAAPILVNDPPGVRNTVGARTRPVP